MPGSVTETILGEHLVEGELTAGSEIAIRIDHTPTQDATGTLAYLQFEGLGLERVRNELAASYGEAPPRRAAAGPTVRGSHAKRARASGFQRYAQGVAERFDFASRALDPAAYASINAQRASPRAAIRRGPFVDIVWDLLL